VFGASQPGSRRRSLISSIKPSNVFREMTRAGLEPATYGLTERALIECSALLSIRKFARFNDHRLLNQASMIGENR
jgi:hypothetical protein